MILAIVAAVLPASALPKLTLDEAVDELERPLDSCLNNVSADFHSRKPGITERSISRLQMERQRHLQEVRLIVESVLHRADLDVAAGEYAREQLGKVVPLRDRESACRSALVEPAAPRAPGRRAIDAEEDCVVQSRPA